MHTFLSLLPSPLSLFESYKHHLTLQQRRATKTIFYPTVKDLYSHPVFPFALQCVPPHIYHFTVRIFSITVLLNEISMNLKVTSSLKKDFSPIKNQHLKQNAGIHYKKVLFCLYRKSSHTHMYVNTHH